MPQPVLAAILIALACGGTAQAAPERYLLDTAESAVSFQADFGDNVLNGRMPVAEADIVLDFARPSTSTIRVALDVTGARVSFPFATEALKSRSVLDADAHPRITFESTTLRASGSHAELGGIVTVRGISRPVTLSADFFRQRGTEPGDLSALQVHIRARISRSDFGATGYSHLVGDEVRILIVALIDRAD